MVSDEVMTSLSSGRPRLQEQIEGRAAPDRDQLRGGGGEVHAGLSGSRGLGEQLALTREMESQDQQ